MTKNEAAAWARSLKPRETVSITQLREAVRVLYESEPVAAWSFSYLWDKLWKHPAVNGVQQIDGAAASTVSDPQMLEDECARLLSLLADQIERQNYREAQETVAAFLRLKPDDANALEVRAFLEAQLATARPMGERRRFVGHRCFVNSVAFSRDGRHVLSGAGGEMLDEGLIDGDDPTMRLWEVATGRQIRVFKGDSSLVTCVAFSPTRSHLVSSTRGGTICLWDMQSGRILQSSKRASLRC